MRHFLSIILLVSGGMRSASASTVPMDTAAASQLVTGVCTLDELLPVHIDLYANEEDLRNAVMVKNRARDVALGELLWLSDSLTGERVVRVTNEVLVEWGVLRKDHVKRSRKDRFIPLNVEVSAIKFDKVLGGRQGIRFNSTWSIRHPVVDSVVWDTSVVTSLWSTDGWTELETFDRLVRKALDQVKAGVGFGRVLSDRSTWLGRTMPAWLELSIEPMPVEGLARSARSVVTVQRGTVRGSGVVLSAQGLIVADELLMTDTLAHLPIRVTMDGGAAFPAAVIRRNREAHLILLRVDTLTQAIPLSKVGELDLGETVFAVSSPLGDNLDRTLSEGVVSAYRLIAGTTYIQSDASLNSGSSGGALLDPQGGLMGIIMDKRARRFTVGVGLVMPIDEVFKALKLRIVK
jgi:S1-C subfamily serine protease